MGKFDVYDNPNDVGYLLVLQHTALDGIATTIVAPLVPIDKFTGSVSILNPKFEVGSQICILLPEYLHATLTQNLQSPIMSASEKSYEITRALDMLFHGI